MKKTTLLLLVAIFLCSCSGPASTSTLQPTEIPPTQIPPTATPKPALEDLDLEALAFQPGDLPEEYALRGDPTYEPMMFEDSHLELVVNAIQVPFLHNDEAGGSVVIALFEASYDRNKVMKFLRDRLTNKIEPIDIGEEGYLQSETFGDIDSITVVYTLCSSVVYVTLARDVKQEDVINYAKTLETRLTPLVCP